MKKHVEKRIVTISCVLTAVLVSGFTLLQGETKLSQKDKYYSSSDVSEEENEERESYSVLSSDKNEDEVTTIVYSQDEISEDNISDLVDGVKDSNDNIEGNYKIYVFNDEDVAKSEKLDEADLVISANEDNKITVEKSY